MWTRYTSFSERGSTNGLRVEGALTNGAIGPEDAEFGVEAPDEFVDAGVLRREDLAILRIWKCSRARDLQGLKSVLM